MTALSYHSSFFPLIWPPVCTCVQGDVHIFNKVLIIQKKKRKVYPPNKHLDIINTSTSVYGVVYSGLITIYPLFIIQFLLAYFKVYAKSSTVLWVQIFEFWFEKVGSRQNNIIDCIWYVVSIPIFCLVVWHLFIILMQALIN